MKEFKTIKLLIMIGRKATMKKTILLSNGETVLMTFEEVLEKFKPMLVKEMNRINSRFVFNAIDPEDFMQILRLECWKAFRDYDYTTGNCFSTYLYPKLQKGSRDATYYKYSKKNQGVTVSASAPIGDGDLKLEDMLSIDDTSMDRIEAEELTAIIRSAISKEEQELLMIILDRQQFSVADYAKRHGITRQAANQRVVKLRKKLQDVIKKQYLEIA